ncbi:MAG: lysylphosphatidylglycerol synthase transmembrane domain-containing protein [Planctomycetia bacterium]|nr:lysylphosphatidylglycerol synthase transmembrane domain-containing protein [Planctomycetia bacterium]
MSGSRNKVRSVLIFVLKASISCGILLFLIYQAWQTRDANGNPLLEQLWRGPKDYGALVVGFGFVFAAVLGTILRWRELVRVLGLNADIWGTLRIGYIGYLFNLAPMGIVGGDLLKAWLLMRREKESPDAAPLLLASVFVDRMIGLYALFMMGSIVILSMGTLWNPNVSDTLWTIALATLIAWGVGTIAALAVLLPKFKNPVARPNQPQWVETLAKIAQYIRVYRHHPWALVWATVASLGVHFFFAVAIYFIAAGIWTEQKYPSFLEHLYISPVSMSTSAIPLPVGPYEMALDLLYKDVAGLAGQGLAVALAYRLVCLIIAGLGMIFYFSARDEIQESMKNTSEIMEKQTLENTK